MSITQRELDKLARLARLELEAEEGRELQGQLEGILAWMQALDGQELLQTEEEGPGVVRADRPAPSTPRQELLGSAPRQDGEYVIVPRAVQ